MKNHIKLACLKFKSLFLSKPKDESNESLTVDPGYIPEEELKWITDRAGITDEYSHKCRQEALRVIFKEQVEAAKEKIINDPNESSELAIRAYREAQAEIVKQSSAIMTAHLMEEKSREAIDNMYQLERSWKKYLLINDIEEPDATIFGNFLVSKKYITKQQIEYIRISAIFVDDKLTNPYDFYQELEKATR